MVDIHCHILPGLDDGALDLGEAVRMAALAVADGVHTLIATPHWDPGTRWPPREVILEATAQVAARIAQANLRLRLLPGAELRFCPDIVDRLRAGEAMALADGGRFALIEFAPEALPLEAARQLIGLQGAGFVPIVAHPERNRDLLVHSRGLERLVGLGVRLQLDASAVLGWDGRRVQRLARRLIRSGQAHYIATDAHNAEPGTPRLGDCARLVQGWAGESAAQQLLATGPEQIVRPSVASPPLAGERPPRSGG